MIEDIQNAWRDLVKSAMTNKFALDENNPIYESLATSQKWFLSEERVFVTEKEGQMVELEIKYPDMGEESNLDQVTIPKKIAAELTYRDVDPSRIHLTTREYKDYSWMCYSGHLKVLLPLNMESLELLKACTLTVNRQIPALVDKTEEILTAIREAGKIRGVTPEQLKLWFESLPKFMAAEIDRLNLPER